MRIADYTFITAVTICKNLPAATFCILTFVLFTQPVKAQKIYPFSTDTTHITVWNGDHHVPLFIKGVNLGISLPGTFPGQLAATREDYDRWLQLIRDAGFNTIRLYTLHFPRFYEALQEFNRKNPNHPLYYFQGVWLEESIPGYDDDLYSMTQLFDQEIEDNVNSVHGNAVIPERRGKAYGTYKVDTSRWMIGYIIGREVHPPEILQTDQTHAEVTSYHGSYFSIEDASASESWVTNRLDNLVLFEEINYGTQRPVSFSSWPSLDPLDHPGEANDYEVSASLDLSKIDYSNAKAGFFISYHAYPYYPDYISRDPKYTLFSDHLGQNSYLGYLTYLKQHYNTTPLIVAEFGAPSSWGVAHYAHNGIHHGGHDEKSQGEHNIRMLQNIHMANGGGGLQFSWIDEWFKRTWITDPVDFDPNRRIIWHNVTAAEQNYGLLGYKKANDSMQVWEEFCNDCPVTGIETSSDFAYLKFNLNTRQHLSVLDTVWVGIDTYNADIGESILPSGQSVQNRAEFALMITNYKAELYVTEAYDLFGMWHNQSAPEQQYRSTATDGAPWKIVRWKNNQFENEVQYIGSMQVNRLDLPKSSIDAVRLYDHKIEIRLPWTLLNVIDPSRAEVIHDDRNTPPTETRISDGLSIAISYNGFFAETTERHMWQNWNHALNAEEYLKESYGVMKERLPNLPGNPVALADQYVVSTGVDSHISAEHGVSSNDLSLDGSPMSVSVVKTPSFGIIDLQPDGSFTYSPDEGRSGEDSFTYRISAGSHLSEPVTVSLDISGTPTGSGFVRLYPNPTNGRFTINSTATVDRVEIYSITGQLLLHTNVNNRVAEISLNGYSTGIYFARIYSGSEVLNRKFMLVR
ncbi:T9SS type A sorting domain-containing protein [Rhodohalobacter sp. 8-1]|uniref:T9SS type A sorting domain-containing protein n=1 Tax=Rhodohalobacter sp. 8-1 TaxID=3131972 RepID=UPI0030EEAB2B